MNNDVGSNDFGARLRWLRESHYWRLSILQQRGSNLRTRLSALAVIECLAGKGYNTTSGSYSELESGRIVPRDVGRFLGALRQCLDLDDQMMDLLREDLAYDIVANRLDEETARQVVVRSTRIGYVLKRLRDAERYDTSKLAECLFKEGFRPEGYSSAASLEPALTQLMGVDGTWPFDGSDDTRRWFVHCCAACLGRENQPELVVAMSDDILRALPMDDGEQARRQA